MKDIYSKVGTNILIGAATLSADNTPVAVDLRDFNAAMICLAVGVGGITFTGTNKIEFKLTHSDDDVTYTDVTDTDVQGVSGIAGGIIHSLVAAHAAPSVTLVGYKGNKRYLKLLSDFGGTHGTGTPISALAILGEKYIGPVNE